MGFELLPVLNEHIVAVWTGVACFGHAPVARRINRGAAGCGVVGAAMRTLGFINRMQAIWVEVRADAGEIQRCHQEGLAHADAKFVVVAGVALRIGIPVSLKRLAAIGETGRQNRAVVIAFAVQCQLLVEHMDSVASAGVHDKVDHTAKNARQFHDHAVAQTGIATRDKQ